MQEQEKLWAPYGPPATTLMIIRHFRQRDVPAKLTLTQLTQLGVGDGLLNRIWSSLRFLRLIEEDGTTTDVFRSLRQANDEQYEEVFRGIIEAAYSDIFDVVGNVGTATDAQLRNAFHPYSPGGQHNRMITFFLGMCREAGIEVIAQSRQSSIRGNGRTIERPRSKPSVPRPVKRSERHLGQRDAALVTWFETRPAVEDAWPTADRDRWILTLRAIIDGIYREEDANRAEPGGEVLGQ